MPSDALHGGPLTAQQPSKCSRSLSGWKARHLWLRAGKPSPAAYWAAGHNSHVVPQPGLLLACALAAAPNSAKQPVLPLPKIGSCPTEYYVSTGDCVSKHRSNTRGAIEKARGCHLLGFYSFNNYCVSSPSNGLEPIEKADKSCPMGLFSSVSQRANSR